MGDRTKSPLTSPDLPQEILLEILSRLPVKTLVRFASVSKFWKSLVTSRPFVTAHLKLGIGRRDLSSLILLRHYSLTHKEERNALYVDGESLVEHEQLRFPVGPSETFYYVGSCNGLLCFADYMVNRLKIVLWNPSIGKLLRLPIAQEESAGSTHTYVVGFGFDEKCDEYKFLRFEYTWSENWSRTLPKKVEIYELRTNAWRSVEMDVPYVIPESSGQVFLDGSIHWIGFRMSDEGVRGARPMLVVFDLHEETFREMEIPDGELFANTLNLSITIYQNSLYLFQCHPLMPDGHQLHGICWVWVMKAYGVAKSWTKLYAIDICELGGIVRVIGFRKHGEALLVTPNDELVSYNSESQKITHLGLYGVANSFELIDYMESLTLLEADNCNGTDSYRIQIISDDSCPTLSLDGDLSFHGAVLSGFDNRHWAVKDQLMVKDGSERSFCGAGFFSLAFQNGFIIPGFSQTPHGQSCSSSMVSAIENAHMHLGRVLLVMPKDDLLSND